jgi:hypothetical protein
LRSASSRPISRSRSLAMRKSVRSFSRISRSCSCEGEQ